MEDCTGIVKCKRGVFGLMSWDPLRPPYPPALRRHQEHPVEDLPCPVEDLPCPVEDLPCPVEDLPGPVEDLPGPVEDLPGPVEDLPSHIEEETTMTNSITVKTSSPSNEGKGSDVSISEDDLSTEANEAGREETDNIQVPEHTQCEAEDDLSPKQTGAISTLQKLPERTRPECWSELRSPVLTDACEKELFLIESRQGDESDTLQETKPPSPLPEKKETTPTPRADKRYMCKLCQERMVGHAVFMQHVQGDIHKERVTAYWRKECSVM